MQKKWVRITAEGCALAMLFCLTLPDTGFALMQTNIGGEGIVSVSADAVPLEIEAASVTLTEAPEKVSDDTAAEPESEEPGDTAEKEEAEEHGDTVKEDEAGEPGDIEKEDESEESGDTVKEDESEESDHAVNEGEAEDSDEGVDAGPAADTAEESDKAAEESESEEPGGTAKEDESEEPGEAAKQNETENESDKAAEEPESDSAADTAEPDGDTAKPDAGQNGGADSLDPEPNTENPKTAAAGLMRVSGSKIQASAMSVSETSGKMFALTAKTEQVVTADKNNAAETKEISDEPETAEEAEPETAEETEPETAEETEPVTTTMEARIDGIDVEFETLSMSADDTAVYSVTLTNTGLWEVRLDAGLTVDSDCTAVLSGEEEVITIQPGETQTLTWTVATESEDAVGVQPELSLNCMLPEVEPAPSASVVWKGSGS